MAPLLLYPLAAAVLLAAGLGLSWRPTDVDAIEFLGCGVQATTVECSYRISWTPDAAGAVDSLIARQLGTGLPTLDAGRSLPVSPVTVAFSRPRPAPLQTIAGTVEAHLRRRGINGPLRSLAWSYTEADIPPPPVTIDTTLQALAINLRPKNVTVLPSGSVQFCHFLRFKDQKVAHDPTQPASCATQAAGWFTQAERLLTPAQRARADSFFAGVQVPGLGMRYPVRWDPGRRQVVAGAEL